MNLAGRLREALDAGHGTDLLEGDHQGIEPEPGAKFMNAAVLIAVTDRAAPGLLLTLRTDTLSRHAGQIAFPGGRIDPDDEGPVAAALREAEEEIALPRGLVTVIGQADRYRTITGFEVTPVIGVVPPDLVLAPSAGEVAEVFEVPLGFVLDPVNHVAAQAMWQGRDRRFYEIVWKGRRIWGATAAMIVNLSRRLRWSA